MDTRQTGQHVLRPEIQALRALAVGLVVVYHFVPRLLPGGYVGVDVFFVISGYLITQQIVRPTLEGRFALLRFWARRAQRLLPAALVVLLATTVGIVLATPRNLWVEFAKQIIASSFYVENWRLATIAVAYSAPGANASPVQHFWSLSVEEQFYIAWPILIVAVALMARRLGRDVRFAVLAVLVLTTVASLVWSIIATANDPAWSYFSTFTRAWEFGLGGLAAVLGVKIRGTSAAVASWVGVILICVSAVVLTEATPFPGAIAGVPVVGAVLVMVAGVPEQVWGLGSVIKLRVIQWLGDLSYSIYLWHWPLLILLPGLLPSVPGSAIIAVAAVLTLVLAQLSRTYVELPFMHRAPQRRPRIVLPLAIAAMVIAVVPAAAVSVNTSIDKNQALSDLKSVRADPPECFGAEVLIEERCVDQSSIPFYPAPAIAEFDSFNNLGGFPHCQTRDPVPSTCEFGDPEGQARVLLVGDSHAAQWLPALSAVAEEEGWRLETMLHAGCPLSTVVIAGEPEECGQWNVAALEQIVDTGYDAVFVSAMSATTYTPAAGESNLEAGVRGLSGAWTQMVDSGATLFVLRDNPSPEAAGTQDITSCLATNEGSPNECAFDRVAGTPEDPLVEAAKQVPGARLLDLTDEICPGQTCPAVVGHVAVYHRFQHVTETYMRTLTPLLGEAIDEAGGVS